VVQRFQGASFAATAWSYFPEQPQQVPEPELSPVRGQHFARMRVSYPTPLFHKTPGAEPCEHFWHRFRLYCGASDLQPGQHNRGKYLAPPPRHVHLICQRSGLNRSPRKCINSTDWTHRVLLLGQVNRCPQVDARLPVDIKTAVASEFRFRHPITCRVIRSLGWAEPEACATLLESWNAFIFGSDRAAASIVV